MLSARIVVFICAVAASVAWALVWRRCNAPDRGRAVLMLSWTLHTALFTASAHWQWFSPSVLNLWSNITRAHGLLAALVLALDLYTDRGCHNG
jgi:ABC-type sugar transport system permease subunit